MKEQHIVIDGGPSAGKTTGMAVLKQRLEDIGNTVIIVPEAATMYFSAGFNPELFTPVELQKAIFELQLKNEKFFFDQASLHYHGENLVFLYDRGLLTGAAYLPGERSQNRALRFEKDIIQAFEYDGSETIRSRYDAVIHMVTAAIGAPESYTVENNPARRERRLEDAIALDHKTREAWLGHRHLRVISNLRDNQKITFDEKIDELVGSVFDCLGYPQPVEIEDKYLLNSLDVDLLPSHEVIDIEQIYLLSEFEERVRIRHARGAKSYYHTVKTPNPSGVGRIEVERLISKQEAQLLLLRRDLSLFPITKKRHCFLFENQYFEVDVFSGRLQGLIMCEREKSKLNDRTLIPTFLDVNKEVTDDGRYKNKYLASLQKLL